MNWNFSDTTPIYIQIVNQIKLMIISGVYKSGDKLPSIRELAADAGVNPNTMQRALQELERDGLIFSQRAVGKYITEDAEMITKMKNDIAKDFTIKFLEKIRLIGFDKKEASELIKLVMEEMN